MNQKSNETYYFHIIHACDLTPSQVYLLLVFVKSFGDRIRYSDEKVQYITTLHFNEGLDKIVHCFNPNNCKQLQEVWVNNFIKLSSNLLAAPPSTLCLFVCQYGFRAVAKL